VTLKSQSPVSWFADLPRGWSITPLGFLVSTFGGSPPSKDQPQFWEGSIPWVSPKDMKRPTISDSEDHVSEAALAQTSLTLIPPPAVLVVVRSMILAHTVPVAITGQPVTINQDMKALLPGNKLFAPFLAYALRAAQRALLALTEESGHGTICLRSDLWQKLPLPTPSLPEQCAIAAYLDRKTAEIAAVIAKKERLIALLQEKRQALISRAVTRGLNPSVPMKDSGIP
jgi:type I restriction enzyme S subunit